MCSVNQNVWFYKKKGGVGLHLGNACCIDEGKGKNRAQGKGADYSEFAVNFV